MVLRGCLETSLYAVYISHAPRNGKIWQKRHEDKYGLNKCKECFRVRNVFGTLEGVMNVFENQNNLFKFTTMKEYSFEF
jgi:hypothetical protein